MTESQRARVVFLIRVPRQRTDDFLRAYERIRYQVAEGVDGHLMDQVCRSASDPEQWLITSEWVSLRHFEEWERSDGHRELVRPMRECMTEGQSLRFTVHAETSSRSSLAGLSPSAGAAASRPAK
ncbi:antibiotic biosynthesis monooxygenase family protein [Micromonospora sp. NPDC049559]|uniref:antibiotic biosynthesis monooxygenase family protein n=1 Tax=Micromonospora sp. NPDC049559 TaxID=3155923 RepID=UPI003433D0A9